LTIKVISIFGTRPEAIKMAPLIIKMGQNPTFESKVCVTGQHRKMLDTVLDQFSIYPDYDLDLIKQGQTISDITVRVLLDLKEVLLEVKPNLVIVQGDTTSTFSAALCAFYLKIPIAHVEAGLRSGNMYSPYPEEMNRILTSNLASIHFAPTEGNKKNLINCGINEDNIYVTGNTVIDTLSMAVKDDYVFPQPYHFLNELDYKSEKIILLTAHRRENWGDNMRNIFLAIKDVLEANVDARLIYPVHRNPIVKSLAFEVFSNVERVNLLPPLDYFSFANLMARCYMLLTDSGGIQEEAPYLGKPVLVLRQETERPEAVEAGTVRMAGIERNDISKLADQLLNDQVEYDSMAKAVNPYGDGKASERIVSIFCEWFKKLKHVCN